MERVVITFMEGNSAKTETILPSWSFTQSYSTSVRGVAPQYLIDTATRRSIYQSNYWNQYCFGVNLVTFVDRAQNLNGVGGVYGMFKEPCNFLCLFLKLLELEPSKAVIHAFLNTRPWQMKHLRLLAALYVRFVFPPEEVYIILEDLMAQYNKVAVLREDGYHIEHFDEVIYSFLNDKFWCGITFPPLTPRVGLPPRKTPLAHMEEDLRIQEFDSFGLTPNGELKEVAEKQKIKETKTGKLKFKVKKPVHNSKIKKENQTESVEKEQETEETPHDIDLDDVDEQNRIRAMLGIPLLEK